MMSRAEQNWPDGETIEIPTTEEEKYSGSLINDLIKVVERIKPNEENHENKNGSGSAKVA